MILFLCDILRIWLFCQLISIIRSICIILMTRKNWNFRLKKLIGHSVRNSCKDKKYSDLTQCNTDELLLKWRSHSSTSSSIRMPYRRQYSIMCRCGSLENYGVNLNNIFSWSWKRKLVRNGTHKNLSERKFDTKKTKSGTKTTKSDTQKKKRKLIRTRKRKSTHRHSKTRVDTHTDTHVKKNETHTYTH